MMAKPRRNDFLIPFLAVLTDATAIIASFLLAYFIRFESLLVEFIPVTKGYPPISAYLLGGLAILPIWLLLFNGLKVYRSRRDVDLSLEFFQILRIVSLGMLIVLSLTFFYREFSYSRIVFVFIWVLSVTFIFLGRVLVLSYEKHLYRKGKELRNLLLVGTNKLAQDLALRVTHQPVLGYRLAGYISHEDERIESVVSPRLGGVDDIVGIVTEHRIETILVCLSSDETDELVRLVNLLEGRTVQILIQPDVLGITPTRLRLGELFGHHLLGVKDLPMTTWSRIAKRTFDIMFSLGVAILFAPFAALIMLFIYLESGRPIFYRQTRVGMDGMEFELLKFRTMTVDAEQASGPTWTKRGDPRVTRMGRVLRRLSLDEIPQFINVLRGEMSVVGPRPERPEFVQQFQQYVPKYLERHRLKTGLTGWAQVNGLRGEVPIAERTKYDLYYIENWSLKLDLRIIFKTLYTILFGKDAY
ncbi:MAG: undecaprenyl-phosphate glucose phosphotransferase [Ignavibacteria bacterium]|nr:MAG: undecaprenyl-phosphate glucose phosphotransferase [Ignavibacteria bacterium]